LPAGGERAISQTVDVASWKLMTVPCTPVVRSGAASGRPSMLADETWFLVGLGLTEISCLGLSWNNWLIFNGIFGRLVDVRVLQGDFSDKWRQGYAQPFEIQVANIHSQIKETVQRKNPKKTQRKTQRWLIS
jgi:hypothetical protein